MELRVLQYFLAVAREQSISRAAESLHLSQPTLSTQLKHLEEELGKTLMIRGTKGSRKIVLTEEGMILRKRAEEILDLVRKTENEITLSDDSVVGDVYIGAGETDMIRLVARTAQAMNEEYPDIHYHISSGNTAFVMEQLDKGLIDFGILYDSVDLSKYDSVKIPESDVWGVLMRRDAPLASKEVITPEDLWDKPLILSQQENQKSELAVWMRHDLSKLNVVATYNLIFNGSLFVDEGMGYAVCFDKLINVSGDSTLCFRPLSPELKAAPYLVWKKYQIFSKASEKFMEYFLKYLKKETDSRPA
ncbi:LysR family transcriptional regulator [Mediterraneibacter glycyrrhizinilyticus]|uniref:LysR family transcriptional regulator n=1 Tax=Mediterraneibacter glycyrrhizinilyticus TaxID=342942 RepID=UPI001961DD15|nr:LysR family transcriptional regulator [Mediterraneibacter glycyrrhizinilyticus]MBM6750803.1 LysR family transcriptional regulator [Mediterraneibacter glycyrrhizinilyticus]HJD48365.1 LysR family transcriptional regulator [Candidatus Mediterraneibacter norfolkensis]